MRTRGRSARSPVHPPSWARAAGHRLHRGLQIVSVLAPLFAGVPAHTAEPANAPIQRVDHFYAEASAAADLYACLRDEIATRVPE